MKRIFTAVVLTAFLLLTFSFAQAQRSRKKDQKHETGIMAPPTSVNMLALSKQEEKFPLPIVQRNAEEEEEEHEKIVQYRIPRKIKNNPPSGAKMLQNGASPAPVANSPIPATTIQGLTDNGTTIPPDIGAAVGPNHLMTTLNSQVRIQNKTGTNLSTVSLNNFWAGTGGTNPSTFDPKVIYDPYADRYIMTTPANPQGANSALLMAVSQTNDPTGTWNRFTFDVDATNANWFDYPMIGFNNKWIVVTGNMFTVSANGFTNSKIFVFNKADLYAGTGTLVNTFTSTGFTISPAQMYDNSATAPMYMVGQWNSGAGALRLFQITGTVGSPAFAAGSYVYTSAWAGDGPGAPQMTVNNRLETNDSRMCHAVYKNGSLWCAHTVFLPANAPLRAAVQWWQINPTTATVQQVGRIEDNTNGAFYFFPSIAVNDNNDVLVGFTQSSPNMYPASSYAFRNGTDPANSMQTPYNYKDGENSYYKTYGGTRNRWGDYTSTCLDPDGTTLWTLQEYSESTINTWGTYWAKVTTPAVQACNGQVTLTACPGTFDDGSGFSNYANNSNCSWLIQPATATSITLSFSQFKLLTGDTVKVYNGNSAASPLLGSYTGATIPASVSSTGGNMFVRFISNATGVDSGFVATYTCNVTTPGGLLSCNGQTLITSCSGTVADGSGTNNYDDFVSCTWLIQPSPAATSITLTFTQFATEAGYDSVKVYNGSTTAAPLLGGYTGTTLPPTISSTGGSMLIKFTSDQNTNDAGWAANYSCTLCTAPATPTVAANPSLTICQGASTTLTASSAGCTGCTYSWNTGATTAALSNVTTAGTYTVTVTNACGATSSVSKTVAVNAAPTATATNGGAYCVGSTIALTSTGGTSYAWAGPSGYTSSTQNPTRANSTTAMGGTYTVTVTNANGCTATATTVVTVNTNPTATAANGGAYCVGNTIALTSTGGAFYAWAGPNTYLSASQNPNISAATAAMAGTYTVTVTNANNCSATATTNVTVNTNPTATASATNSGVYCVGNTIGLSSTGGTTYAWAGPNSYSSATQNPNISGATTAMSGTYTVTVTNANNCSATATKAITVNANPSATATGGGIFCAGLSTTLLSSGGTSYAWAGPGSFTSSNQNLTFSNLLTTQTGTYIVTVTDANNCSATASTALTVNAVPTATASNNSPLCVGGMLHVNAGGGTTYAWTGPNGFTSAVQFPMISSAAANSAGIYTVTVSNANNCTATATTNVTVNALPTAAATNNSAICAGTTLTLNGTGGTSYAWVGPNGFTSNISSPSLANATTLMSGTYTVTVTDANNCSATASTTATVNALPNVSATNNTPLCEGGTINFTSLGGVSYAWTGPNGYSSSLQNPSLSNATQTMTGAYSVVVTDANNCSASIATSVTVNNLPTPVVSANNNGVFCQGENLSLSISGGTNYSWSGPNSFASTLANPVINNIQTIQGGVYAVIVSDANSCTASTTISITVNALPIPTISNNVPLCVGGNINLTGGGGTAYAWTGPNNYTGNSANVTLTGAQTTMAGTYILTVTDANNCSASTSVNVVVNALPVVNVGNSGVACVNGLVGLTASGGTTYAWVGPNNFTSNLQNPSLTNAQTNMNGVYTVTVTDANNCSATGTTQVTVNANPTATASNLGAVCQGSAIVLGSTGGTSYAWAGPNGFTSSLQNPSVPNAQLAAAGAYTVTVTNADNCTATATTNAVVNANPVPNANATFNILWGASAQLNASGGGTYSWQPPTNLNSTTIANPVANPTATTTYYVTVTNAAGCKDIDTVFVNVGAESITPAAWAQFISVYPNPTDGNLFVNATDLPKDDYSINLYAVNGQLIKREDAAVIDGHLQIAFQLESISSGVYLLRIVSKTGNGEFSMKVQKK
jgi:hypothetical protein